jgi:hypothetical protein
LQLDSSESSVVEVAGLSAEDLSNLERGLLSREEWNALLSVRVASDQATSPDLPAVLGAYTVSGGVLRFVPQFPLEPGTRYDVELDPSLLASADDSHDTTPRLKTTLQMPAAELKPTTRVIEVHPTTSELPENQLRLYITFSAPMSLRSGAPHIRLLDARGRSVVDPFLPLDVDLWNEDRTRYTVLFDPGRVKRGILPNEEMGRSLIAGRRYTLVVDANWLDEAGQPLVAPFRRDFLVGPPHEQRIDPAEWRLALPPPRTREPLTVSFPRPLDYGLLKRALRVTSESGERLDGDIVIGPSETRWLFTPRGLWQPGEYRLVATSTLEDVAGNRIGKPFEVAFINGRVPQQASGAILPFKIQARGR